MHCRLVVFRLYVSFHGFFLILCKAYGCPNFEVVFTSLSDYVFIYIQIAYDARIVRLDLVKGRSGPGSGAVFIGITVSI